MAAIPAPQQRLFVAQVVTAALCVLAVAGLVALAQLVGRASFTSLMLAVAGGTGAVCFAVVHRLERRKVTGGAEPDYARQLKDVRDSRRIIVSAFEIERRRIERDLHDGAQQFLVAAAMKLGEAQLLVRRCAAAGHDLGAVPDLLEAAHQDAELALQALRRTVSGLQPRTLTDLGLHAAVSELAAHSGAKVTVRCPHRLPAMPEGVAAVAWFFCSEALTNVVKHARGAKVSVLLAADEFLHVSIVDNGPGGAQVRRGGGLEGLRERLAAFGGAMTLTSPAGGPTTLAARIPLLLTPARDRAEARCG